MLLLTHSTAISGTSKKALCNGLAPFPEIAKRFATANVSAFEGTWTSALRERSGQIFDSPFANAYRRDVSLQTKTVALAKPLAVALGLTDVSAMDDATTRLTEADSRALCEAADQHLEQDGVRLRFIDAATWCLESSDELQAITEHPMFIIGENIRQFLPRGRDARTVERWMNELQMLFFNHPVNVARQEKRLPPINFVWLYGFSPADAEPTTIELPTTLFSDALKQGDVAAWQAAWTTLEPQIIAADGVILGDAFPRLKLTFQPQKKGLFSWFAKKPTLSEVLLGLQAHSLPPGGRAGERV